MVLWSLPRISAAAGGAMPFDMRPFGYSFEEAKAFLAALSPDGAAFYLDVQHRLDLTYPALLAATLFFAIKALTPARFPIPGWVVGLIAIPGSVFDYLENVGVAAMLERGADGVTPALVARASLWTLLKSVFSTIAMIVLLVLAIAAAWRRFAGRGKEERQPT
jgi:hypothetical protein